MHMYMYVPKSSYSTCILYIMHMYIYVPKFSYSTIYNVSCIIMHMYMYVPKSSYSTIYNVSCILCTCTCMCPNLRTVQFTMYPVYYAHVHVCAQIFVWYNLQCILYIMHMYMYVPKSLYSTLILNKELNRH